MAAMTRSAGLELGVPEDDQGAGARLPRGRAREPQRRPARRGHRRARRAARRRSAPSTCTCCRRPPAPRSSRRARRRSGWRRPAAPTTSSTWSCRARRSRSTWPRCGDRAGAPGRSIVGCGHAGDGNVHLSVFQKRPRAVRTELMHDIFAAGMTLGGAISGEHGIGTEKKKYFAALEDPAKLDADAPHQGGVRPARHPQPRHHLRLTARTPP